MFRKKNSYIFTFIAFQLKLSNVDCNLLNKVIHVDYLSMINNIKENLYPVKLKYYLASPAIRIYETKYFFANPFS